ncbi:hypothetical protein KAW18_01270 [candidate division WOR-3 bacterium]|nr:hypothetical protein [candidate division WOR-3 bacterium]
MTGTEVIVAAFQELGIIVSGGTPSDNDLTWGLGKLNRMLKSWSADGLNLHYRVEEFFSLVSGTTSYTIGSGANFDTVRPKVIEQAFIRDSGHDYPVGIRPAAEYWTLREKTTEDRPLKLYYDPTYPNGTIYLYYTPNSVYSLHIVSQKPLLTYVSAGTEIILPGEYEDCLVLNLAIRFASRYGKVVSGELRLDAQKALSGVRGLNLSGQMQGIELGIPGGRQGSIYNIDSDY